jgi:hypothetical protein
MIQMFTLRTLWWFVVSCSPGLHRDEHVELLEKLEGKMLKQSEHLCRHDN